MEGILFSDGNTPLVEEWINPVFGYQATHKFTGRILPTCNRFEIFTWNAMLEKIENVYHVFPHIDTTEYLIEAIYQSEVDIMNGFIVRMSEDDYLDM